MRNARPDQTAKFAILESQLQSRLCGRVNDLRLTVCDHGLILHGRARTYYAKQLAQHAVMDAQDLPLVANEIQVLDSTAVH